MWIWYGSAKATLDDWQANFMKEKGHRKAGKVWALFQFLWSDHLVKPVDILEVKWSNEFLLTLFLRFYPKTTVPMAGEGEPAQFETIEDTYKWAFKFIDRASISFGYQWVANRLRKWRWNMTTAFSGVGCAEAAFAPDHGQFQ